MDREAKKEAEMKKLLFGLLIVVLVFSGLSCFANEVADYASSLNLPPEIVETLAPLGKDGMDESEKALVDAIYFLPQEVQVSETVQNLLSEIAQDTVVASEELDRFKDLDQDGLNNQWELTSYKTDPLEADSDHDGLDDSEEILTQGTDPLNPDSDDDGLKDGEEVLTHKTNPLKPDSDFDGLNDGDEVLIHGTNPLKKDTDNDRLSDQEEVLIYKSDPLDRDDPLRKDSDGDGVIDCDDLEPLEENSYKETVSWLSLKMKWDALSCIIESDKVQTFRNLHKKVFENVPHAKMTRGQDQYPSAKWDAFDDWCKHPRDILMNYYSYHMKVQQAPDCDDIACVYDIMADYIIEQTGWDEEGEKQGNNGVDCDVFPNQLEGDNHLACIVNINGVEYLADSSYYGRFIRLGQDHRYKFPWNKGWVSSDWGNTTGYALQAKFDKRFCDSIYNRHTGHVRLSWDIFRNQIPENEERLEELYLKIAYQGD